MKTILFILIISLFTLMPLNAQNSSTREPTKTKEELENEEAIRLERENTEREMEIEDKYYEEAKDWLEKHMKKGDPSGNAKLYSEVAKRLSKNGFHIAAARILQTYNINRMPEEIKKQRGEVGSSINLEKIIERKASETQLKEMKIREKETEKEKISQNLNSIKELYNADLTPQVRKELESIENTLKKQGIIRESNIRKMRSQTTVAATNNPQQQPKDPKEELEPEEDLTPYYKRIAELKEMIQQELLKKQQEQKQQQ